MAKRYINCVEVTRPNGKKVWRARLVFDFDEHLGYKPAPKDFYGSTAAEADRKRKNYKAEKETIDRNTTLVAFVKDVFLPHQKELVEADQLSYAYYKRRAMLLTKYLLEPEEKKLKDSPLRQVSLGNLLPAHIAAWFECLRTVHLTDENRHRLKLDMRAVLKMAKPRIPHSPATYFEDLPKSSLPKRQNQIAMFDPRDVYNKIIDESLPIEDRAIIAMPFILNRRPSEIFALQWSDVDLVDGTIYIGRAVKRIGGGKFKIGKLKTKEKGIRVLPLGAELQSLLSRLHKSRPESEFVFLTKTEKVPYNTQNFKKNWPMIKKSLGLPDGPTYYSLKHLGNSYALSMGVSAEVQAWKMGHTSTKMAMEVYREIHGAEKISAVTIYSQLKPAKKELVS